MFRAASGFKGFLTFAAPSPRIVWAGARPGGLGSQLRRVAVLFLFATGGGSVKARHWLIFFWTRLNVAGAQAANFSLWHGSRV
jgi:hypothetical protein